MADIGTDHAYLPIWAIRQGLTSYAVASDINEGPLEAARRNMIRLSGATFRPISRSHRRYLPPLMCLRMQWQLRAAVVLNGKTDSAKAGTGCTGYG